MNKIYSDKWHLKVNYARKRWRIMRLTIFLISISLIQVRAACFAQRITLQERHTTLEQVLKKIRTQSGYDFYYDRKVIDKKDFIDVSVRNSTIEQALDTVLDGLGLTYSIDNNIVVVKLKAPTLINSLIDHLNAIDVQGFVTDEAGNPLLGANVRVKNSNIVTSTNNQGQFYLQNIDERSTLQISFIGFLTKEVKAASNLGTIKLISVSSNLNEVKVNKGYYSESRRLTTGSVSSVSAQTIEKQPVSNPLAALQGRVPGLVITQSTGTNGGAFDVQIRGRNSIASSNLPLYIIDGVPFPSNSNSNLFAGSTLNGLNPDNIESIEILKDADAVAIYGSRGANGIVLITTKKGKSGKTTFNANFSQGIAQVGHFMNLLNTEQYLEMRNEAFKNEGKIPSAIPGAKSPMVYAPDLLLRDNSRYTDWQKKLIGGSANYTDANVSVSGGNINTQFLLSVGKNRQTTVTMDNGADNKSSVNLNINHSSENQKFKLLFSGNYLNDQNSVLRFDPTNTALTLAPNAPELYASDGSLNWANSTWSNPAANLLNTTKLHTENLIANANLSYQLLKGLTLRAVFGYTTIKRNETFTRPFASYDPALAPNSVSSFFSNNDITTWIAEPQVDYAFSFGKNKFSTLIGSTFQQDKVIGANLTGSGYTSDALLTDIASAATVTATKSIYSLYKYNGIFGRINYSFDDKYVLNVTGRRDGSSKFGPGKQFANFLAVGAAYIFTDEDFFKENLSFLSFGKLRGSFGSSGSDNITDYGFLNLWPTYSNSYLGVKGPYVNRLFNPDYQWEENRKLEGGLDLGFINNRINLGLSYYRNISDNQLIQNTLPALTGFSSVVANRNAKVLNSGIEVELNGDIVKGKNFKWNSGVNLTIAKNKLLSFPDFDNSPYKTSLAIGYPLSIVKTIPISGVNPNTGLYQFTNAQGEIVAIPNPNTDRTKIIDFLPKFYGGFQNQVSYRNLSIDFLFQFVKRDGSNNLNSNVPGDAYNQPVGVLNRWQSAGDNTDVQRYALPSSAGETAYLYRSYFSDGVYSDASFIRLKNVSISYQFAEMMRKKLRTQNVRLYLQGQNLFTITKYKGLDPETQSTFNLPVLRVVTAGLQVTF